MTEVDTSVEVLRGGVGLLRNMATQLLHAERTKLADIIEGLAAERDAHKARADRYDTDAAAASIIAADRDRLAGEVERLRAALSKIERADFNCAPHQWAMAMRDTAHAALGDTP